jgi:hypothetical protein
MTRMMAGVLLMAMTGCADVPPAEAQVPVRGDSGGKCDAAKARVLVGKSRSKAVGAKALRLSGAAALRWVPKDGMVTMDYRGDRLNLHLDSKNRIVRIACG